jgi:hypothetical protein
MSSTLHYTTLPSCCCCTLGSLNPKSCLLQVLAGNKAMHMVDVPLQFLVNILVKASLVAANSPRLERQVPYLLRPCCPRFILAWLYATGWLSLDD